MKALLAAITFAIVAAGPLYGCASDDNDSMRSERRDDSNRDRMERERRGGY